MHNAHSQKLFHSNPATDHQKIVEHQFWLEQELWNLFTISNDDNVKYRVHSTLHAHHLQGTVILNFKKNKYNLYNKIEWRLCNSSQIQIERPNNELKSTAAVVWLNSTTWSEINVYAIWYILPLDDVRAYKSVA